MVNTAGGKKVFLLPKPDDIVVVGRPGGKVDLNCGPQEPVRVRVEYAHTKAGENADGVLKILHFEP